MTRQHIRRPADIIHPHDNVIGTQLGQYRIEQLLGSGGMGQVYRATDARLGRCVALKVLSRELAQDPDRRERFEREARAAAALNHPNIVTIHSVEEVDGVHFLTLELIEGRTLADTIPAGGLPLDRVLELSIPLADAVGAAHERGITHRDLKPANVMLTSDGRVKILDFGLAKIREDIRVAEEAMPTRSLTGEGRIVGTVAYMSPEQAEGRPVDQRSDVFSLGVMLYEMATGVRPFQGDTQMSILSAIIKDTPKPIAEIRPGLPRDLSKIVSRCLAKDVEDRYQSAKDLRNDLRALKNDLTSGEIQPLSDANRHAGLPHIRSPKLTMAIVAASAVVLAILLTISVQWIRDSTGSSDSNGRPFDSTRLSRLTTTGNAVTAAISPDGRYVAYVISRDRKESLWLRQIAATSNVELTPPEQVHYVGLTFSSDGNHIYYVTDPLGGPVGTLYQIPLLGGGARRVIEDVDTAVTFSPDGTQLAFLRRDAAGGSTAIIVTNIDGTNERTLATRKRPLQYPLLGIAWSPDGKSIAVTAGHEEDVRAQIAVVDVATGKETVLSIPDWRRVVRVAWLPEGSGLLANAETVGEASTQIFLVSYPAGSIRRLTNDLSSYSGLSAARDGRSFVAVRNDRRATMWTLPVDDPSRAAPVTTQPTGDEGSQGLAWAPDGRIVYTTEASGNPDIWIMNPDGSRRVQLTSNPGHDISPRVTNDGRYVVFLSDRDGGMRAWRMGLDGAGATRVTSEIIRGRLTVSHDGNWIYYNAVGDIPRRASIEGGRIEDVFPPDALARIGGSLPPRFHDPMPSPDGLFIAGHYQAESGERIAVIPTGGGPVQRFETVQATATWSPDGKAFIYIDTRGGASNLVRQSLTGGPSSPITKFTSEQIFSYAVSPDQKQIALVRGQVSWDVVLVTDAKRETVALFSSLLLHHSALIPNWSCRGAFACPVITPNEDEVTLVFGAENCT